MLYKCKLNEAQIAACPTRYKKGEREWIHETPYRVLLAHETPYRVLLAHETPWRVLLAHETP